jgi:hypothetical protein
MTSRSKTVAAWTALLLGAFGAHRIYLKGWGDRVAWLYPLPSLLGLWGMLRLRSLGQDDHLAWMLIPLLGLAITAAMLSAIVYALTPDDRWDERYNAGRPLTSTDWITVMAAIVALFLGGGVLMATLAFSGAKIYQWQAELPRTAAAPGDGQSVA